MRVKDLMTKIRLRVGDMQGARYSDYELLAALNDAFRMLWIALAECFSTLTRARKEITLVNGSAPLPENYYTLVSVEPPGSCVDGLYVRGEGESVTLSYNVVPPELKAGEEDDIAFSDGDIAFSDSDPLVPGHALAVPALALDLTEMAAAVMQGNTEAAASIAASTARRVSQKREYARLPDRRHFR